MKTQLSILASLVTVGLSTHVNAVESDGIQSMLKNGQVQGMLRYRYENVEQDGLAERAHASTLLTRFNYKTATLKGVSALLEFDNVTQLGNDNYNSTVNGKLDHPVVADPKGTEVNQASLQFKNEQWQITAGRQRINLDDQRFVGGVAWRQNEQTFDGYRVIYKPTSSIKFDYSYIYNVNRIFGEDSPNSDLHGKLHFGNALFQVRPEFNMSVFAYLYDFDNALTISTQTIGLRATGQFSESLSYTLSYAMQQDYADNPQSFDADYFLAEFKGKVNQVGWKLGYELLGSDNGISFTTPLATGHKFQGFADKFLNTPNVGIADLYFGINGELAKVKLSATYHRFESDEQNTDFGDELDVTALYPVSKDCNLLFKYAHYNADEFATDTDKLWVMLTHKF
ncbi:alginate export family protein [Pseudoalteromonas sp. N1230-9]|uniref:alginate export family protein n=1 Tax=Pseudoalteromonas sp. N1230-9 TaxID=2907156 RepID=UPI002B317BCD|nr:alginate export family protein [Pseudoalteromonas sp. N1230-9]